MTIEAIVDGLAAPTMLDIHMTSALPAHALRLATHDHEALEVDAGTTLTLSVDASCPERCSLHGTPITVYAVDEPLMAGVLEWDGAGRYVADFTLKAPDAIGTHTWTIRTPRLELDTVVHDECILPIEFATVPHRTSLAVWEVTSPSVANGVLKLRVGARCSCACSLAGEHVEIYDDSGCRVGDVELGKEPLDGTAALHWAEAALRAPGAEGVSRWSARLRTTTIALAHEEAAAIFSLRTDRPPDHRVTVVLRASETGASIGEAEVRLGLYVGWTDTSGQATFELPKGCYELGLRADGFEAPPTTVEVCEDVTVGIEALRTMTQAEREDRLARFVDIPWG